MSSKSSDSTRRWLAALAIAVATAGVTPALADTVIAVPEIKGKKTDKVTEQLEKLIRQEYKLASRKRVAKYYKRSRYRTDPGRLARKVKADYIVVGTMKRVKKTIRGKKRRRYRLRLKIYDQEGKRLASFKLYLRTRSLRTKERRAISKKIAKELPDAGSKARGSDKEDEEEREDEVKEPDRGGDEEESSEREIGQGDLAALEGESGGETEEKAEEPPLSGDAKAEYQRRGRAVSVGVGLAVASRSMSFNVDTAVANTPEGYSGFPFGGVVLDLELYPLAFNKRSTSALRDLGVTVTYKNMLFISSQLEDAPDVDLPTSHSGYGVGLIYRFRLGDDPSGATVFASLGYNKLLFELDQTNVPADVVVDVPNVDYAFIDPGIGLRYPLGAKAAIYGGAKFLYVTDAGPVTDADEYGDSSVLGAAGQAGFDYALSQSLFLRALLDLRYFAFDFNDGPLTDRDNDGNQDVGGARDLYFSGGLSAGYLF